jgi:farnesyl diphosphate synthase
MQAETSQNLTELIALTKARVNSNLDGIFSLSKPEKRLVEAMRYATMDGGKRIRPLLVYASAKAVGARIEDADAAACAVELIHSFSLVHDDLPVMDDDDLRRGHPTCHVKFDEATAILVGDAFQSLAFEIISHKKTHNNSEVRCNLITELAKSSGAKGMVGGQMLDLEAERKTLSLEKIFELQRLKTGELFRFSCIAPCLLAEKYDKLEIFENFSSKLGLAFQIKDDLLDVEGNIIDVGKKTGKDHKQGKETLVSLLGIENAKKKSQDLIEESIKIIEPFGEKAKNLIDLANFIISRNK